MRYTSNPIYTLIHCTASFSHFLIYFWLIPVLYMFVANTGTNLKHIYL